MALVAQCTPAEVRGAGGQGLGGIGRQGAGRRSAAGINPCCQPQQNAAAVQTQCAVPTKRATRSTQPPPPPPHTHTHTPLTPLTPTPTSIWQVGARLFPPKCAWHRPPARINLRQQGAGGEHTTWGGGGGGGQCDGKAGTWQQQEQRSGPGPRAGTHQASKRAGSSRPLATRRQQQQQQQQELRPPVAGRLFHVRGGAAGCQSRRRGLCTG